MNQIEITVEEHEAYVAAAAERDTLRKQLADLNHKYAALLNESAKADAKATIAKEERDTLRAKLADDAPFVALGRWAASMVVALSDARPADESRAAAINAFIDAHARQKARIEELEREVAKATAAPLRIVLDQGMPTEEGWYFQAVGDGPPHAEYIDDADIGHKWTREGRWSRRLDIVVPESEVGE